MKVLALGYGNMTDRFWKRRLGGLGPFALIMTLCHPILTAPCTGHLGLLRERGATHAERLNLIVGPAHETIFRPARTDHLPTLCGRHPLAPGLRRGEPLLL